MRALSGHIPGKSAKKWTHARAEWTHLGRTGGKGGHISAKTEHIGPKSEHIEPKSEHIGRKTEHLAGNAVNTSAAEGRLAMQPIPAPVTIRNAATHDPAAPSLALRDHLVYNRLPHLQPPLGAFRSHGPRPPAVSPCPSDVCAPPRPSLVISAPADGHPIGPRPHRPHAGLASPALCPKNSRIRPQKSAKTVAQQPAPLKGRGLLRDRSPFIPHRATGPSSAHPG